MLPSILSFRINCHCCMCYRKKYVYRFIKSTTCVHISTLTLYGHRGKGRKRSENKWTLVYICILPLYGVSLLYYRTRVSVGLCSTLLVSLIQLDPLIRKVQYNVSS